jgi:hypothetical protein
LVSGLVVIAGVQLSRYIQRGIRPQDLSRSPFVPSSRLHDPHNAVAVSIRGNNMGATGEHLIFPCWRTEYVLAILPLFTANSFSESSLAYV